MGTVIGIVGIAVAVFFGVLATVLYLRSKKEKVPNIIIRGYPLISVFMGEVLPESISLTYEGKPIKNLWVTDVTFWNSGKEPIRAGDVPSTDPITIRLLHGEILDAKVTKKSSDSTLFECNRAQPNSVEMSFEYLDQNDGGVIRLFHTGRKGSDVVFGGKVIGAKIRNVGKQPSLSPRWLPQLTFSLLVIFFVTMAIMGVSLLVSNAVSIITTAAALALSLAALFYSLWQRQVRSVVPSTLEEED